MSTGVRNYGLVQEIEGPGAGPLKLLEETEEFRRVPFDEDDVAVEASLLALIAGRTINIFCLFAI
jgi:hypothetical protein